MSRSVPHTNYIYKPIMRGGGPAYGVRQEDGSLGWVRDPRQAQMFPDYDEAMGVKRELQKLYPGRELTGRWVVVSLPVAGGVPRRRMRRSLI